jgi:hypothetical protein
MILATDAPLDARQLKRLAIRAGGLARTGSAYGHGSGDIALAFSTAQQIEASAGACSWRCWPIICWTRCSMPPPTAWSKPSCMRSLRPRPCAGAMAMYA